MTINEAALVELGLISQRLKRAGELADVQAALEAVKRLNEQVVFARDLGCSEAEICFALGFTQSKLAAMVSR